MSTSIKPLPKLRISLFADGANKADIIRVYREGLVKGFTTNPTLMAKAGLSDYEAFARGILAEVKDLPFSFEVFSDEWSEMERQALLINSWGENVNVKIPITNTRGEPALPLIRKLLDKGLKLNVTAILTQDQLNGLREVLKPTDDIIVSIFAGRIADTGLDPMPIMKKAVIDFAPLKGAKVLWASPREVLNIYQADECGCAIITATPDLIDKLKLYKKDLNEYSLDTVKMFYRDAQNAGFRL